MLPNQTKDVATESELEGYDTASHFMKPLKSPEFTKTTINNPDIQKAYKNFVFHVWMMQEPSLDSFEKARITIGTNADQRLYSVKRT